MAKALDHGPGGPVTTLTTGRRTNSSAAGAAERSARVEKRRRGPGLLQRLVQRALLALARIDRPGDANRKVSEGELVAAPPTPEGAAVSACSSRVATLKPNFDVSKYFGDTSNTNCTIFRSASGWISGGTPHRAT